MGIEQSLPRLSVDALRANGIVMALAALDPNCGDECFFCKCSLVVGPQKEEHKEGCLHRQACEYRDEYAGASDE